MMMMIGAFLLLCGFHEISLKFGQITRGIGFDHVEHWCHIVIIVVIVEFSLVLLQVINRYRTMQSSFGPSWSQRERGWLDGACVFAAAGFVLVIFLSQFKGIFSMKLLRHGTKTIL